MSTLNAPAPTQATSVSPRIQPLVPRVNLRQDNDGYTLEVEMPGVSKDGVEVTVEEGRLTLTGRRKSVETPDRAVYRERSNAEYRRVFDLDPSIDSDKISAQIEQGLLTVRLLKSEALKPRRITVS